MRENLIHVAGWHLSITQIGGVTNGTSLEKRRPAATAPAPSEAKARKQGKMRKSSNVMRRFGIALCMAAITVPHTLAVAQTPTVAAKEVPAEDVPTVQDEEFAPVADVIDFRLGDGGLLVGEVRNQAGRLLPGRTVRVLFEGKVLASAKTDSRGRFRISGLREGEHDVEVCDCAKRYRLWSEESAPPKSEQCAKLVCCEEVAVAPRQAPRPQRFRPLKSAFANYPIATAALVVAGIGSAIAIPLSVGGGSKPASP